MLAFIANSRPDQQSILWLDEILLGPGVGIEDESIEDISVFPNPTARYIQVEEAHRFQRFLLIDETGRTVMQGEMTNRIDLSKVANGSYLLKLEGDHSNYKTVRVVKSE